jgi:hypothetical protein
MKILLVALLLLLPLLATAEIRVPQPECIVLPDGSKAVDYDSPNHFWMDFCINELGTSNPVECRKYQMNSSEEFLLKDITAFLDKKTAKLCGE